MTESDLTLAIREKFAPPEYAFLPQVRNQVGFKRRVRTADAIAVSCYPSRGIYLHGFEVKSARGDWLRESKDPSKAEDIAGKCHFFWVVSPVGVALASEIPANWGLLHWTGKALDKVKEARLIGKHKEIPIDFVAAILRKAQEFSIPIHAVEATIKERVEEQLKLRIANSNRCERPWDHDHYKQLREKVKAFELASGVSVEHEWDLGGVGRAVKIIKQFDGDRASLSHMKRAVGTLKELYESADRGLAELTKAIAPRAAGEEKHDDES